MKEKKLLLREQFRQLVNNPPRRGDVKKIHHKVDILTDIHSDFEQGGRVIHSDFKQVDYVRFSDDDVDRELKLTRVTANYVWAKGNGDKIIFKAKI